MATIRDKMFTELDEKILFEQARAYAFDYNDNALSRNVFPTEKALENLNLLVEDMPESSGDSLTILKQLHEIGSPATVAQNGGRYFGFVNGGVIPASLATKWLTDFWDQNTPLYVTSPITSKLEEITEQWLKQLLGLPDNVVAGFVSGTSMSIFCGLAAARYRILKNKNWDVNKKGLNGSPKIRIVTSKHTHGAVKKAVALLGLGIDNIELVEVDSQGRIKPSAIPKLDDSTILILQAGNVNSGSFDPFDEICDKAVDAKAWIHIDGAFGLWAAGAKQFKHLTRGIGKANSWSLDGHKTLNTPYDNGILLCNDREALVHSLQATGSYIEYSDKRRDGMMYTPEMSRRARVVELWAALKFLGTSGIDELICGLHERAVQFREELQKHNFQILNDVVFNQVIVSCDTDEQTEMVLENLQRSGECWMGGSSWFEQSVIRISVCSWVTTEEDVSRTVRAFVDARKKAEQ